MRRLNHQKEYPAIPKDFLEKKKARFEALGKKLGLVLLYAHGSVVQGPMGPLSDIDIAVAHDPAEREKGLLAGHGALYAELCDIFGRDDIDIADLDHASPLLRYLVTRNGKCLYARSENKRVMFEFRAMTDYLDTIHLRHIHWLGLTSAIQSGEFYS